jgi:TonB family protein
MKNTISYKIGSLALIAATMLGMTACDSSDYTHNKSSDSSATATSATNADSTGTASNAMTADSAASANATATSANATAKKKRKGRTSITWPMAGNEKITRDNDGVYNRAETAPEFPGGQDALATWLNNHVEYTQQALDNNTDGTIQVSFVVDENGKVIHPKVISSKKLGSGLEEEALRAFDNMPSWKPGKVGGKKVKTRLEVPITFQLEDA